MTEELKGGKVYDPRKKKRIHSDNPALIMRDVLIRLGMKNTISRERIIEMANYCDEECIEMCGAVSCNCPRELIFDLMKWKEAGELTIGKPPGIGGVWCMTCGINHVGIMILEDLWKKEKTRRSEMAEPGCKCYIYDSRPMWTSKGCPLHEGEGDPCEEPYCEAMQEVIDKWEKWADAYPERIFTPFTDEELKEHPNIITRASASMGRHILELLKRDVRNLKEKRGERE
jgi:hypothetical protein